LPTTMFIYMLASPVVPQLGKVSYYCIFNP